MKSLELSLNKRLLIVEDGFMYYYNGSPLKYICKGSDLTEDVVKGFIEFKWMPTWGAKDYVNENNHFTSALESFISAIESKGYHWGENTVSLEREKIYRNMGDTFKADGILKAWREAESRTFNPSKCIIFEIV